MTLIGGALLETVGFTADEAGRRAALFGLVESEWLGTFGRQSPSLAYHVPGRIEVLGKHTDYAGGRSLVCATEQGLAVLARPRDDGMLRILDTKSGEDRTFPISPGLEPSRGDWGNYPMTVARRFATDFGPLHGADIAFASDLPFAAGVSSSSAIVVAVALLLIEINRLATHPGYAAAIGSPEDLGGYLGAVENGRPFRMLGGTGGVGTMGGNQDQTAILCARPNALVQYRFDPVTLERVVPWPSDLVFAIAASGVVAEKTGAALEHYNGLARLTARLAELAPAGAHARTLGAALIERDDVAQSIAARLAGWPDRSEAARLLARLAQLSGECRLIIPGVAEALARGDRTRIQVLVEASQQGAELGLGNQIAETIALVELAREHGAIAASAFGAGFGGSVWAMVDRGSAGGAGAAAEFAERWRRSYLGRFPHHAAAARVVLTRPALPATRLRI